MLEENIEAKRNAAGLTMARHSGRVSAKEGAV